MINDPEGHETFNRAELRSWSVDGLTDRVLDAVDALIVIMDGTGTILHWNTACEVLSGWSRREAVGRKPWELVVPPEAIEPTKAFFARMTAGDYPLRRENIWVTRDGRRRTILWSNSAFTESESRRVEVVFATGIDITERKAAERALNASERKYRHLFEHASDSIFLIDPATRAIVDTNENAARRLGYAREEMVGLPVAAVNVPENHPAMVRDIGRHANVGDGLTIERIHVRKDGSHMQVEINTRLIDLGDHTLIQACARDIGERKQREAELLRLAEELKRSNDELRRFAQVASHDLQEPLRRMASFLDLLERRERDHLSNEGREYIDFVVGSAKRMSQLITDLLDLSRVDHQRARFDLVSLREVIEQVVANLRGPIAETGAELVIGGLPRVYGVRPQLVTLFQYLLDNALKYRHPERPPRIEITAEPRKYQWAITVRDNGLGFDPQYAERIFVVFQRLHHHDEYGGTGVGLAVCRKLVERHQGRIWAESEPGKGSTFHVVLPAMDMIPAI